MPTSPFLLAVSSDGTVPEGLAPWFLPSRYRRRLKKIKRDYLVAAAVAARLISHVHVYQCPMVFMIHA